MNVAYYNICAMVNNNYVFLGEWSCTKTIYQVAEYLQQVSDIDGTDVLQVGYKQVENNGKLKFQVLNPKATLGEVAQNIQKHQIVADNYPALGLFTKSRNDPHFDASSDINGEGGLKRRKRKSAWRRSLDTVTRLFTRPNTLDAMDYAQGD